jgi:hypothetical protein
MAFPMCHRASLIHPHPHPSRWIPQPTHHRTVSPPRRKRPPPPRPLTREQCPGGPTPGAVTSAATTEGRGPSKRTWPPRAAAGRQQRPLIHGHADVTPVLLLSAVARGAAAPRSLPAPRRPGRGRECPALCPRRGALAGARHLGLVVSRGLGPPVGRACWCGVGGGWTGVGRAGACRVRPARLDHARAYDAVAVAPSARTYVSLSRALQQRRRRYGGLRCWLVSCHVRSPPIR